MSRNIILNRIKTPDGTILTSYHRHDYKTYTDDNGETYMVDGGNVYLRRNMNNEPYTELSVYDDAPFAVIRQFLHWGTRGPEGNQPLKWKPLKDLDTDHIRAILVNIRGLSDRYRNYMEKELSLRGEKL